MREKVIILSKKKIKIEEKKSEFWNLSVNSEMKIIVLRKKKVYTQFITLYSGLDLLPYDDLPAQF